MPARWRPFWHQMVNPVLVRRNRLSARTSTPAQRRRSVTNVPKKSSPTTPTKPTLAPRRARLNAKMELEPPSTRFMSVASFSFSNSSFAMPSISRSALASPATRQSRRLVFINANALDDSIDDAARTRAVRIQLCAKAQMVCQKLREDDLKRSTQNVGQLWRHGGSDLAERWFDLRADSDDSSQFLVP